MAYVELHLSEVIAPPRDISGLRALNPTPFTINYAAIEAGRYHAGLRAAAEAKVKLRASAEFQARKALIEEAAKLRGCTPKRMLDRMREREQRARIQAELVDGREVRMEHWQNTASNPPTLRSIVDCVCAFYNLTRDAVIFYSKDRHISNARQVAMLIIHETFPSLTRLAIGRFFSGRDHSTVTHGMQMVEARMAANAEFAAEVGAIREALRNPGQLALPFFEAAE